MNRGRIRASVVVLALMLGASGASAKDDPVDAAFVPPADYVEGWYARIETSRGRIVALLHPDQAPQAVAHFAALAEGRLEWRDPRTGQAKKAPYYDGIPVHFVRAGHLFEVGDPHGGRVGVPQLYLPREAKSPRGFERPGRLGFARSGSGLSAVVFFVTAAPDRSLERNHNCFGTVVSEMDVVYSITEVKARDSGRPIEPIVVDSIRIFAVGNPPPLPDPAPYTPPRTALEESL